MSTPEEPAPPERARRRTGSASRIRPGSKLRPSTGANRPASGGRQISALRAGRASALRPPAKGGKEIGIYRVKGLTLRTKFALAISITLGAVVALAGYGVAKVFERRLRADVVMAGCSQALSLRAFGRRVVKESAGRMLEYLESEDGQRDLEQLSELVDNTPWLSSVALLVTPEGSTAPPSHMLVYGGPRPQAYTVPDTLDKIPGAAERVDVWEEIFKVENHNQRAMFFRAPIYEVGGRPTAVVQLVVPLSYVKEEVDNLVRTVVVVALVAMVLGVALAFWLAGLVTRPVSILVDDLDRVAKGEMDHEPRVGERDEIGILALALRRMLAVIRDAQDQDREVQRLSSDLDLAAEVVAKLMPERLPELPGYEIRTIYQAARELGGDYYDFIEIDDDHLGILIADVSGKSVGGALVVCQTQTVFRMIAPGNQDPVEVLWKANHQLTRALRRDMFVTAVYGVLNKKNRTLHLASAGHTPLLWWRKAQQKIEEINPKGMVLGIDKGPLFKNQLSAVALQLEPGDRVLFYTDGVDEATNADKEHFGLERLRALYRQYVNVSGREFLNHLRSAIANHEGDSPQHDDMTATILCVLEDEAQAQAAPAPMQKPQG